MRVALFVSTLLLATSLFGQTIEEKKAALASGGVELSGDLDSELLLVNNEGAEIRKRLREIQQQAEQMHRDGAPSADYQLLALEAEALRDKLRKGQREWREQGSQGGDSEPYALWYQPETTIEQLVMDYGAQEYLYLMPLDVGSMKVTVASNLAIPKESWTEILEWILAQNGIGIRQANPYLRILYPTTEWVSSFATITNDRQDLQLYGDGTRICFSVTADPAEAPRIYGLLKQFAHPDRVKLNLVDGNLFLVGTVGDLREIMKVVDFATTKGGAREYRLINLSKLSAEEMAQLLTAVFHGEASKEGETNPNLLVLPLKQLPRSLFLLGSTAEVARAEEVIDELESQLGESQGQSVYHYQCKHTEAEELATVLEKVYALIVDQQSTNGGQVGTTSAAAVESQSSSPATDPYADGVSITVKPPTVDPSRDSESYSSSDRTNFIVDEKTGTIIMVVEPFALERLKKLIRRLDVPKKMVRIEVLLFEKKHSEQNNFGLNLLALGDKATGTHMHGAAWNDTATASANRGILEYMLSRTKASAPIAFDLSYRLLLGQENVQINASPSVVTVNQTTAYISLVDEISLNTGVVEIDTTSSANLKDSFVRAQYGISIEVTPTIHSVDDDDEWDRGDFTDYITLDTDITFDTTQPDADSRPNVTRRHLQNQVRIANGETVILGGLRQKKANEAKDSIPFLGEIPGFGKLFSNRSSTEDETELFIMLTPTIVEDPLMDFARIREKEMTRRPGDLPEFLERLVDAREKERKRLLRQSIKMLLSEGEQAPKRSSRGEYDGRG